MTRHGGVARLAAPAAGCVVLAAVCVVLAACGGGAASDPPRTATLQQPEGAAASPLRIVALGDSETSGDGDSTGLGWVGRYARLLRSELGLRVDVSNLARDGMTSADLLADLRRNPNTRTAVENADIVLLGVGGADLNAGDDDFAAGKCRAEACYAPVVTSFARNFDAIVGAVRALRGRNRTVLRSITQPNVLTGAEDAIPAFLRPISTRIGVYQARNVNRAICRAMVEHDGRCIDVLHTFNGVSGRANAYKRGVLNHEHCCYPSAKGQQVMAELLFRTGLAPVR